MSRVEQTGRRSVRNAVAIAAETALSNAEIQRPTDDDEGGQEVAAFRTVLAKLRLRKSVASVHLTGAEPCFDYWTLLLSTDTREEYDRFSGRSAGTRVIEGRKRRLPDYRKHDRRLFQKFLDSMPVAVEGAKRPRPEGASAMEGGKPVERLLALAAAESN